MKVAVLGAGTMGGGIAQVSAMTGHEVTLRDIEDAYVDRGIETIADTLEEGVERGKVTPENREGALERIAGTTDLDAIEGSELVIEAVPEEMALKKETVAAAERVTDGAVIASNTSSSLTEIAGALDDPSRAIGLHFFNPVHLMDLVEVVVAERTAEATVEFAAEFIEGIGKETVVINDTPGFATSRLGVAIGVEAIRMVEQGVASPRAIDRAMELGYNHPMGPLELTDLVGLDVRLDILEGLREELGERFRPPQLLKRKVRAGKLGKKTGEGFYYWEDGERTDISDGKTDK
ncbi:MAG: 3-hydroxyacyl-CoA dehydrogenase family protein [Euryarchaeota archaeon]|jgi:3-hydroxybutyryl-CoA dehydrogenase|nr:3-hydroxyacyl-CoA dehydrogenase family protein [Euryarchaeota archaeon]